ncbi:probable molybdenum cofactor biosynthesis protein A [Sorangium cellulosum So ce56]|uniref:Probable molybdenum cofactor biosynthesis protein A n=1 Tax=Sorangium cellulosum (strain So ce56) TaxID=448385 RepID=A9GQC3_SORC5|nr:probable molybdenum cofactor biosynthesis protein A [Sorangium cellulosum So ce56]
MRFDLWGQPVEVYRNANFSIYSRQPCNAKCHFCVEELRPASRGRSLSVQKTVEDDDGRYFDAMAASLEALRPLDPTISVTGGEPSHDPRLPRILALGQAHQGRKRTLTTNGSGLLQQREGKRVIDWIVDTGIQHLNISRAHPDHDRNARLMVMKDGLRADELRSVVAAATAGGTRVRLSCVLLEGQIDAVEPIVDYLRFARSLGVDNVIFRQLMKTDPAAVVENHVVKYSDRARVRLEPLLDALSADARFSFERQIVGYYYYVEVFRFEDMDVVFEEADLAQLEETKRSGPGIVHELIFHPNARLASTWHPWDGVLGPPPSMRASLATS